MNGASQPESPESDSRIPRRLLFAGAAAGLAGTAVVASAAPVDAASATTPWMLGGNSGVTTSNFLGPTTAGVPLIFKTKENAAAAVSEKMRLTAAGQLAIGLSVPSAKLDVSTGGTAVRGTSSGTSETARGIAGSANNGYGVEGLSQNNIGIFGRGTTGVKGSGTVYGLWGEGNTYGAYISGSTIGSYCTGDAYGVYGAGSATGVYGQGVTGVGAYSTNTTSGNAVFGSGGQYGVHGANSRTAGVRGDSGYVGVWGEGATYGVYGNATSASGQVYGVFGAAPTGNGYGLYSNGNAHIAGTLSKTAGSFRIDHPLAPETQWLSHSFVESPDMMNVYNGNVTTDGSGSAIVTLPGYFEALNRDFRYQLTVIGVFAQAIVSKKVAKNSFTISTDKPNVEVSWQVTGIRQDDYAKEHPIVVETTKAGADAGAREFVPRGSAAKAAPAGPGDQAASVTPAPLGEVKKPQDLAR